MVNVRRERGTSFFLFFCLFALPEVQFSARYVDVKGLIAWSEKKRKRRTGDDRRKQQAEEGGKGGGVDLAVLAACGSTNGD